MTPKAGSPRTVVHNEAAAQQLTPADFKELGFLQEINRLVLHPAGIAIELDDNGQILIWDHRHDSRSGIQFTHVDPGKADRIRQLINDRADARKQLFGSIVQPITTTAEQPT